MVHEQSEKGNRELKKEADKREMKREEVQCKLLHVQTKVGCNSCGKWNHFTKCCRSSKEFNPRVNPIRADHPRPHAGEDIWIK